MTTFSAAYDPRPGPTCVCGAPLPAVHAVLAEKAVCTGCLEEDPDWAPYAEFLTALDDVDTVLALAGQQAAPALLHDAERLLRAIGATRVPHGHGEGQPDDVFAAEVLRRMAEYQTGAEPVRAALGALAPHVRRDTLVGLLDKSRADAVARAAANEAETSTLSALMLLFARAPGCTALGDAVAHLRLDPERYLGAIAAAAAATGVPVDELPVDQVDAIISASRIAEAAT